MRNQSRYERRSDDDGKSEGCIVPMEPGNSGEGKAAERWRDFIVGVSTSSSEYDHSVDYEHEHRDAEYEHGDAEYEHGDAEYEHGEEPGQSDAD